MSKGETLAEKRYGHLEPQELETIADGLWERCDYYWRRSDLPEAKKTAREAERVEAVMKRKGCYDDWNERRSRAAAIPSLEALLGQGEYRPPKWPRNPS